MKRYLLLLLVFTTLSGYAQNTINNYKYILVPEQYSFFKEVNQYGLNNLTKNFLEQKGFTVYFDNNDLPAEIANNKCKALHADLTEKKNLFTTTLTLLLKDCKGKVIFKGNEGKSREKEFSKSYYEALKNAFVSLNKLPYTYTGQAELVEEVNATEVVTSPANQPAVVPEIAESSETLYAQVTANGYQLIDTTPKKVLTLYKTSIADCFIGDNGQHKGVVLKRDGKWFFEYYHNDKLTSKELLIKF